MNGVRAAGVPHAALGRVALVGDPHVGPHVGHAVILHGRLGVAHDLHDDQVPGVRHHERPLVAQRGVVAVVQGDRVLVQELIFQFPLAERLQVLLGREPLEDLRLHADEITCHVGRADLEQFHLAVVVHGGHDARLVDIEERLDEVPLHLAAGGRVEQGDLEDVVVVEHAARHAQFLGHQAAGGDPASLAVAAVAHLDRRLVDVLSADGDRAGEPRHAAAALGLLGLRAPLALRPQMGPRPEDRFNPSQIVPVHWVCPFASS